MPTPVTEWEESSWSLTTSPKTSSALSVEVGDVLVVLASGTSPLTVSDSAGLAWTLRQSITAASYTPVYLWTATVAAAGSLTVTVTRMGGSSAYGVDATVWRGVTVGASAQAHASGAPSLAITTAAAGSAVVVMSSDWNGASGTSRTWRTGAGAATELAYEDVGSSTYYVAYHAAAGAAGAKTVGLSAPSGQKYSIVALSLEPDTTAPTAGTLAASGATATSLILTATGAADAVALSATPYSFSTDNGATWSAWQAGAAYTPTGLVPSTAYTCKHRVRDQAANVTVGTGITVSTLADSTPPIAGTLASSAIGETLFTLTVSGASDNVGLHATPYSFSTDNGATWSAWQAGAAYTPTGLVPSTAYTCKHRVRDQAANVTVGTGITVSTLADSTPPIAGTLASSAIGETLFTLTVSGASDNVGLHATPYSFSTDNGATWSAWQADNIYISTGRAPYATYQCRHRVQDTSGNTTLGTAVTVQTTDITAPYPGILTIIPGVAQASGSVAGATDSGGLATAPYSFRVDSEPWSDWQSSTEFGWALDILVSYNFQHRVRDVAGNIAVGQVVTRTTEAPPPPVPPPPPPPVPVDEYLTHRKESVVFTLLDHQENELRALDGVTSAALDLSIFDTIRSGGSLSVVDEGISWLDVRVKVSYIMNDTTHPLGVFIPSTPTGDRSLRGTPRKIELYDKLLILVEDGVDQTYEVPVGTVVTERVRSIILSTGETSITIEDSTETLKAAMVWEVGTSKLRIINDLLDTVNYWALWCDENGVYRSGHYTDPEQRTVTWTFADSEKSIYLPTFSDTEDNFSVPNKYICLSRVSGDVAPFVAVASNTDPNDPYSYPRRHRWIVVKVADVEATSQAVLNAIAARKLKSAGTVTRTFVLPHAWVPISLNDAVVFSNDENVITPRRCVVQKMAIDLSPPGVMVKTTLREIRM
ncbi:MAG: hypothetical protein ACOYD1_07665 [Candidatus Nanopelagicales bacterium]